MVRLVECLDGVASRVVREAEIKIAAAKVEIRASGEHARRSLGQRVRWQITRIGGRDAQ